MRNTDIMVTILKAGAGKRSIPSVLKKIGERQLNAQKYCGTVKFKKDGLILQRRWRDEWE